MNTPVAAWVGRPLDRPGLDNLGTQQPCVLIYSYLLPGITNVTDRATYYGFYPWFIRSFIRRWPESDGNQFRSELRKADCLLTLIAQRHGHLNHDADAGRHGGACPGSRKLIPAVEGLGEGGSLSLSRFADRSVDNTDRYFKNPLGGLGQYYLGALRDEMGVLSGNAQIGIKFIEEVGNPIADDFANDSEEEAFFKLLEKDQVSWSDLDSLAAFCPCALADGRRPSAQARLIDLLFGESQLDLPKAQRRRGALGLALTFLDARGGMPADDTVRAFLTACYSGSLDGETEWRLPDDHEAIRRSWALYARNEMLSLAWLGLFKAALDCLDGLPKPVFNVAQAADWLLEQEAFSFRPSLDFDDLIATKRAGLPPVHESASDGHEVKLWLALIAQPKAPAPLAVALLAKLIARQAPTRGAYASVEVRHEALSGYPLTLDTLAGQVGRWSGMISAQWLRSLLIEVLSAHQRVAIRKLGQSGEDTLMFRAGEGGLFVDRPVDSIPETQPRLQQTFQILRDLGLCEPNIPGQLPRLTPRGNEQLIMCGI